MAYCSHCGSLLDEDAIFCPQCGQKTALASSTTLTPHIPINQVTPQFYPKGQRSPFLLTLLLGPLGVIIAASLNSKVYRKQGAMIVCAVYAGFFAAVVTHAIPLADLVAQEENAQLLKLLLGTEYFDSQYLIMAMLLVFYSIMLIILILQNHQQHQILKGLKIPN